jgi:integrase/recombinase XerD
MAKSRDFNELYEYTELGESSELEVKKREYTRWLLSNNFAPRTVETRGNYLSRFVGWCHQRGIFRPQEVSRKVLELYREQFSRVKKKNGEAISAAYLSMVISGLRGFFKWLTRNNYILYNPASEMELPRKVQHIPHNVLSASEVEAVIMQVDLGWWLGLRDRALLEVLYSTGIRRFELCKLQCRDIFMESGVVLIREGKGRKDRMVPIGERALAWVEKYKQDLRPVLVAKEDKDEGTLFLSCRGKSMAAANLNRIVSDYVKAAGIGKEGSCHMFRHTMATLMLENGADIRYIQQILGHSSLDTTRIYTHVSIKKLKEVHAATHPGALLQPNPTRLT